MLLQSLGYLLKIAWRARRVASCLAYLEGRKVWYYTHEPVIIVGNTPFNYLCSQDNPEWYLTFLSFERTSKLCVPWRCKKKECIASYSFLLVTNSKKHSKTIILPGFVTYLVLRKINSWSITWSFPEEKISTGLWTGDFSQAFSHFSLSHFTPIPLSTFHFSLFTFQKCHSPIIKTTDVIVFLSYFHTRVYGWTNINWNWNWILY